MLPGYATPFAFYFFDSFSYITTVAFFLNRRKVYSATKTVVNLCTRITPRIYVGSKTIIFEILLLVASSLAILSIFIIFFFYQEWNLFLRILHAPYFVDEVTHTWIVVFSLVSIHTWSFCTCFISVLLCYNSFIAAGDLLKAYGSTIQDLTDRKSIIRSLELFGDVSNCVKRIDKALNSCVFFLFGTVVGNFFAAVSVLFSESRSYHTPVASVYVGLTLLGGMAIILVLTTGGNSVTNGMKLLKSMLLEGNRKIAGQSQEVISSFTLLSDCVRGSSLSVSGCEMFTINKRLALTIGGMIVTYSFLLFQLSGKPLTT
ncbi:uncharacterized protein CDAR_22401 [Caerostris darwini]|uniref:Gustatory receptor n=1 Tax=Caerostris darwini TaxID=1538125 RepID=A0AAV4UB20_9ARAC|nr:uncharacterized protein CDAR_22401 [Caerostris darwini]